VRRAVTFQIDLSSPALCDNDLGKDCIFLIRDIKEENSVFMIAFDLVCANGHQFECWFKNGDSFEEQKSYGVITCPVCQNNQGEKVLTPVAIRKHAEKS